MAISLCTRSDIYVVAAVGMLCALTGCGLANQSRGDNAGGIAYDDTNAPASGEVSGVWQSRAVEVDVYGLVFYTLWAFDDNRFALKLFAWIGRPQVQRWDMIHMVGGDIDREGRQLRPNPAVIYSDPGRQREQPLPDDYEITYQFQDDGDTLVLTIGGDGEQQLNMYRVSRKER